MKRAASVAGLPTEAEVRPVVVKRARADGEADVGGWTRRVYFRRKFRNDSRILPDGSVEVKLTHGLTMRLDADDYAKFKDSTPTWWADTYGYASMTKPTSEGQKNIKLHQLIMSPPPGMDVDHINRDVRDNRKANLRIVTRRVNLRNMRKLNANTSGHTGISETGVFCFTYHDGTKFARASVSYRPHIDGELDKAHKRITAKHVGKLTKTGKVPTIFEHRHFLVKLFRFTTSDSLRKNFSYRATIDGDRKRALDEAIAFRDAAQARCNSTNGKPASVT